MVAGEGGCVCVNSGGDNSDWNFDIPSIIGNYWGTNLAYDMLCEPIISDNEKEGDNLSGN